MSLYKCINNVRHKFEKENWNLSEYIVANKRFREICMHEIYFWYLHYAIIVLSDALLSSAEKKKSTFVFANVFELYLNDVKTAVTTVIQTNDHEEIKERYDRTTLECRRTKKSFKKLFCFFLEPR